MGCQLSCCCDFCDWFVGLFLFGCFFSSPFSIFPLLFFSFLVSLHSNFPYFFSIISLSLHSSLFYFFTSFFSSFQPFFFLLPSLMLNLLLFYLSQILSNFYHTPSFLFPCFSFLQPSIPSLPPFLLTLLTHHFPLTSLAIISTTNSTSPPHRIHRLVHQRFLCLATPRRWLTPGGSGRNPGVCGRDRVRDRLGVDGC